MVDPATLAVTAMVGTAVSGVIGGMGAQEAGQAAGAANRYKAGVALINKQVNEQNASWALQAGETQAVLSGLKSREKIGQQKVVQAASGLDVNSGTNKAVRDDMGTAAAYEENVIRWDAAKTAYGYEVKAATDTAQSNLDRMAGEQSETAGEIGMISSFVNAGTSVAGKWSQGKSIGIFS